MKSLLALLLLAAVPAAARPPKVMMVIVDGADWGYLVPCMSSGRCPNFRRLANEGASSSIVSPPTERSSPVIWTTIATGKSLNKHGVPAAESAPVSTLRRVKALWNIYGEAGWTVGVFGYRVTNPTEPVNGVMIPERTDGSPEKIDERTTAAAEEVLKRGETDLAVAGLVGVDLVSHKSLRYLEPSWEDIPKDEVAASSGVLPAYYEKTDAWLGRLLKFAGPKTQIVVLADHGSGRTEPWAPHSPGGGHRVLGIFMLKSEAAVRDGVPEPLATVDVLPTLLYLSGLPAAADMDGHVFHKLIKPDVLAARPITMVKTYETSRKPVAQRERKLSDKEIEGLKALGYIQ